MNRTLKRVLFLLVGIFLIGIGIACYRIAGFGTDSLSSLVIGLSSLLGISFGTMQLILLTPMLVLAIAAGRDLLGPGTIVNMVCVGYSADLGCYVLNLIGVPNTIPVRIVLLLCGIVIISLGVTLYMEAGLGVAPYEALAVILSRIGDGKLQFRYARIITDVSCVILGIVFCLIGGNSIWIAVGIGTVAHSFANGPLIQKFNEYIKIDRE